jgi:hypothetical protein
VARQASSDSGLGVGSIDASERTRKEGKSDGLEIGIGSDADRAPIVIVEFVDDPRSFPFVLAAPFECARLARYSDQINSPSRVRFSQVVARQKMREALVPPNPNELVIAYSTLARTVFSRMRLNRHSSSTHCTFVVGGAT